MSQLSVSLPRTCKNNGPAPRPPGVCRSEYYVICDSSDGVQRRIKCACSRAAMCSVCSARRIRSLRRRIVYSTLRFRCPKFLTLTFRPEYVPVGLDAASSHERAMHSFKLLRRRGLDKVPAWIRVEEYGSRTGRVHLHLVIDDPEDVVPVCAKVPKFGKDPIGQYLARASPAAREFYSMLKSRGFGVYHCERVRLREGAGKYLTKYLTKEFVNPDLYRDLKGAQLFGFSGGCAKDPGLGRRYCYKAAGLDGSTVYRHERVVAVEFPKSSERFLTPVYLIPPMQRSDVAALDDAFQLQGVRDSADFREAAAEFCRRYDHAQYAKKQVVKKDPMSGHWFRQYVDLINRVAGHPSYLDRPDGAVGRLLIMYRAYLSLDHERRTGEDLREDQFEVPDFVHEALVSAVECEQQRRLLRHDYHCTASIRFLRERLPKLDVPFERPKCVM